MVLKFLERMKFFVDQGSSKNCNRRTDGWTNSLTTCIGVKFATSLLALLAGGIWQKMFKTS